VDTTQLLKGVLDLAVLAALRDDDGYGYDILRRLRAAGLEDVGDASVYGTLRRLFNGGFLNTYVVPSDELQRSGKIWDGFASTMNDLLRERGTA
jgi:PadR family transcriptional regulator PadR